MKLTLCEALTLLQVLTTTLGTLCPTLCNKCVLANHVTEDARVGACCL